MYRKSIVWISCLAALLFTGCSSNEVSQGPASLVPVVTTIPEVRDVVVQLDAIGNLYPSVRMNIVPQASGTISDVLIREGEWVKPGTALFKIDPVSYEIKILQVAAQLRLDQASLTVARKKYERFKELAEKDLVAQTEWDQVQAMVAQAEAVVDQDEARLRAANLDLEACTVECPIEGRVGKMEAHPGMLVSSGQSKPLVTVSQLDPLIIEFSVTEKEFVSMPTDLTRIQMKSLCAEGLCSGGEVTFVDSEFDSKTGLLLIRGRVSNRAGLLRPGQTVRVSLPVDVKRSATLVPQKAVRYNQQGPYAYVVQPDMTIALRQLILGIEDGQSVIVLQGLDPSEHVVIEGHLRIAPGAKVEVKS